MGCTSKKQAVLGAVTILGELIVNPVSFKACLVMGFISNVHTQLFTQLTSKPHHS